MLVLEIAKGFYMKTNVTNIPYDSKRVGEILKTLRKKTGITVSEEASIIGCQPQLIYAYEKGSRTPPDKTKVKLANLFNLPVSKIFFE